MTTHARGEEKKERFDPHVDDESAMKPYSESLEYTDVTIEMVPIPGGKFLMGSPDSESGRRPDEGPRHEVRLDPFWMGKYEITWEQYEIWSSRLDQLHRELMGQEPNAADLVVDGISKPTEAYTDMSFGMGKGRHPAICMTQHAARTFCRWLSAKTGKYYRLPTEAEWEYAARAGSTTRYCFGDDAERLDQYGWFFDNADDGYREIGRLKPNAWGLHDMHGNVAEWVLDQYDQTAYSRSAPVENPLVIPTRLYPRVVRGGGWDSDPADLRSAARSFSRLEWKAEDPQIPQSIWYFTNAHAVGFRIVRPLVVPAEDQQAAKWERSEPIQTDP
ncbi:formylglycine-generating enzyme family protein [Crateriforma conspicua]|nr:formylglycine-generating enzyme family protein [Crateriforma conspicua]